jgi:hypothetical protein
MIDSPSKFYSVTGTPSVVLTFENPIKSFTGDKLEFVTKSGKHVSLPITSINEVSRKVTVTGNEALQLMNFASFLNDELTENVFAVSVQPVSGYYDESHNNGSSYSKWISKMFVFDTECDGVEVKISSVLYDAGDVKVYYKVRNSGITSDFSKMNWIPFNPHGVRPNEIQKKLIKEGGQLNTISTQKVNTNDYEITPGLPDNVDSIKVRSSVNVDPRRIIAEEWQTLIFSVQDLFKFDAIAIKVVLNSHNPALTPLVDDISVIATE